MNNRIKWAIVLFGIVVFALVSFTALDSYDERSCLQNPPFVPGDETIWESRGHCDGFLPW